MADENNDTETQTDIFQQQKKTIDTLIDVLERQGSQQPQTVYVAQDAEKQKPTPNYLVYAAVGLGLILFFKK